MALAGCGPSHDMSLEASCKEYLALSRNLSDLAVVAKDVRKAAPRWHEAVAEPAVNFWDASDRLDSSPDGSAENDAAFADFQAAANRLNDLFGTNTFPEY